MESEICVARRGCSKASQFHGCSEDCCSALWLGANSVGVVSWPPEAFVPFASAHRPSSGSDCCGCANREQGEEEASPTNIHDLVCLTRRWTDHIGKYKPRHEIVHRYFFPFPYPSFLICLPLIIPPWACRMRQLGFISKKDFPLHTKKPNSEKVKIKNVRNHRPDMYIYISYNYHISIYSNPTGGATLG